MPKKSLIVMIIVAIPLFFAACGKRAGWQQNLEAEVQMLFFSAPWCGNCKDDLKLLHKLLGDNLRGRVNTTVYVVSDERRKEPTEQTVQDYYKYMYDTFGIDFNMVKDPWRYKVHQSYFKEDKTYGIPGAVILSSDGTLIEKFVPSNQFDANKVYNGIIDAVGN